MIDFANEIVKLTGTKSKIIFKPLPKDDPKKRRPDISKAKALLEWSPKTKRKKGLLKTYEYFKTIGSDELIIKPKIFC